MPVAAQPNRFQTLQSQVFDILFPRNGDQLFFTKTILRFGDSATQIVIILFGRATGQGEVYEYRLRDMKGDAVVQRVWKAMTAKADVTAAEIASGIRVDVTRTPIKEAPFVQVLDELKPIQLSPLVPGCICLDDCPVYEFWHDTNGESVYYALRGPILDIPPSHPWPQDRLAQWITTVRSRLPYLLKEAAEPGR